MIMKEGVERLPRFTPSFYMAIIYIMRSLLTAA